MNKYLKLIKNTVIFGLGKLSVKLAQFIVMPILTLYLTAESFGINEVLLSIRELAIPLLTLGIADALFRFAINKKDSLTSVFTNGILVMVVGIAFVSVTVPIVYIFVRETYVILMLPLLILNALCSLIAEFVRGQGKTIVYSVCGVIESIFFLGSASLFLIVLKLNITGYILALIVEYTVAIIYFLIFANPVRYFHRNEIDKNKLKAMISFSLPNVPNMFSWWLVQTSSKYILIGFSGLAVSGLYMAAGKIPALINIVSMVFLQAWSLSSSEEYDADNRDVFYSRIFRYYSFLVLLAVTVLIAIAPYVSKILLQGEFYKAWIYSPILILSGGLGCFSVFFGAFYSAFYKTKTAMYTTFLGGGVNLALSFALIPFIGVYGAMIGNLVGYVLIVLSRIITTRKYTRIQANWGKIIIILFLILGQAISYTLDWKYAYIISIILVAGIIVTHIKEIMELFNSIKKFIDRLKNKDKIEGIN